MAETSQNKNQESTAPEIEDWYVLTESDQPMTALTQELFNGENYLSWSRQIRTALGTKSKLGFVDGTLPKPGAADANEVRWNVCDSMVQCWLLSSMTPELSKNFVFVESARKLWTDISEKYKPSHYHVMYQLSQISQVHSSVTSYFNKLKKCWEDLEILTGLPSGNELCFCDFAGKFKKIIDQDRLMQFLLKLSNKFADVKGQILLKDPLPSVQEAYDEVLRVEALYLEMQTKEESAGFTGNSGKIKFCMHCKRRGHIEDQCFDIIGFPPSYKRNRNKNRWSSNEMLR